MKSFEDRIARACEALRGADAILIGAGAGLSAAAGLDYSGPDFRKEFADYIRRYGFRDLYSSSFYDFPTEEERWARWARHIDYIRFRPGAMPLYTELHKLVENKNYFVITTNVDGQFAKAGFDRQKLFEVQGDYGLMQCAHGCHAQLYSDADVVRKMLAESHDLTIPSHVLPKCPVCGGNMDVHVRKNRFFVEDEAWHEAAARYENFINGNMGGTLVLLELGVGFNTPGIIRYPFEVITSQDAAALLVRVNSEESEAPQEIAARTVSFTESIPDVISRLNAGLASI